MEKFRGKPLINTYLNINNIFGEYEGRVLPVVLTLGLAGAPFLLWLFFLQGTIIKLWMVAVFDIFWGGRWALKILGKEDVKIKYYLEQRADKGSTSDEIVHIKNITESGIISYDSGRVYVAISGYLKSYLTDDKLSVDLESFMDELDSWDWDFYMHSCIDELRCEDNLPKTKRYTDKDVIRDRVDFYSHQDDWASTHTGLFRLSFLVTCPSYDIKKMYNHLSDLVTSDVAGCFNEVELLDYDGVIDLMGRDVAAYIDIRTMLLRKFDNDNFYGSSVMWYDENIPKEIIIERETVDLEERRQT